MEEIKQGYKQTDIGVIPEDWENLIFKNICWVNQGLQINISDRLLMPKKDSKIYITIQYLNDGKSIEYIDNYNSSVCCNEDDILMTRTGNTGIVVTGVSGVFHNNFFKINIDRGKVDKNFLVFYLNQSTIKKIILTKAGTSTIPDLNHSDFYSIPIILPTKSEQTAIATALSDTDALIAVLDKKIVKKQQIKQGAMQQLLTGKKRLPWFSGEWMEKKLGDIAEIISGGTPDTNIASYWDGNILWCTPTDITSNKGKYLSDTQRKITSDGLKKSSAILLPKGTLLLCSRATIGEVCIAEKEITTNQGFKSLICNNEYSNEFIYYLIPSMKPQMLEVAIGSTFLEISKSNIEKIVLKLPQTKSEQTAIAQILTDMDNEIEQLEKERDKYKELKAGMMQVLLTGKIRLI